MVMNPDGFAANAHHQLSSMTFCGATAKIERADRPKLDGERFGGRNDKLLEAPITYAHQHANHRPRT